MWDLFGSLFGGMGMGMQAAGAWQGARAENMAARWNAGISRQNALNLDALAANERAIGERNAHDIRREAGAVIGQQRALTGASGAKVDVGSSAAAQAGARAMGEYDAQTAMYNAEMGARKIEMDAKNSRMQANMSLAARRSPWMAAATPIITGVTDLMWKHHNLQGGFGGGGGKTPWWKCPPRAKC